MSSSPLGTKSFRILKKKTFADLQYALLAFAFNPLLPIAGHFVVKLI
jgi:hypothetical protein